MLKECARNYKEWRVRFQLTTIWWNNWQQRTPMKGHLMTGQWGKTEANVCHEIVHLFLVATSHLLPNKAILMNICDVNTVIMPISLMLRYGIRNFWHVQNWFSVMADSVVIITLWTIGTHTHLRGGCIIWQLAHYGTVAYSRTCHGRPSDKSLRVRH